MSLHLCETCSLPNNEDSLFLYYDFRRWAVENSACRAVNSRSWSVSEDPSLEHKEVLKLVEAAIRWTRALNKHVAEVLGVSKSRLFSKLLNYCLFNPKVLSAGNLSLFMFCEQASWPKVDHGIPAEEFLHHFVKDGTYSNLERHQLILFAKHLAYQQRRMPGTGMILIACMEFLLGNA